MSPRITRKAIGRQKSSGCPGHMAILCNHAAGLSRPPERLPLQLQAVAPLYAHRYFCTVLAVAAFAAVTVAFTGIPGYVKPRFSLASAANGVGAGGRAGDSNRWQDLAALDPEVGMWSHHQKRQRMKHEAARRHHEMRQQATGTAVHGEDPQVAPTASRYLRKSRTIRRPPCNGLQLLSISKELRRLRMSCLRDACVVRKS